MNRSRIAPACLLAMFVSVAGVKATENPNDRVSLWDERVPYPSRDSVSYPRGVADVVVHRASGKYNFLHDANIVAHKGKLLAAWYNCPRGEMVGESVIRGRWSTNAGQTWSDVEVIADRHNGRWGDQKGIMYVPIALRSHRGALYGFVTNMKHGPDLVHKCEAFVLNDQTGAWTSRSFIAGPFLPNCPPQAMEDGNYIMAGRMAETPGQKPLIPAELHFSTWAAETTIHRIDNRDKNRPNQVGVKTALLQRMLNWTVESDVRHWGSRGGEKFRQSVMKEYDKERRKGLRTSVGFYPWAKTTLG